MLGSLIADLLQLYCCMRRRQKFKTLQLYVNITMLLFYCLKGAYNYVAAKATYIRLLHGKIGFFVFFSALAPYKGVGSI